MDSTSDSIVPQVLAVVIERWRGSFRRGDADALKALWDRSHHSLTYLAADHPAAMRRWSEIDEYYGQACTSRRNLECRVWDIVVSVIDEQVAFATAHMDVTYQLTAAPGQSHFRESRITFHFFRRSKSDPWLIIHFEDSTVMYGMLRLVSKYQEPILEKIERSIRERDFPEALSALTSLKRPLEVDLLTPLALSDRKERRV